MPENESAFLSQMLRLLDVLFLQKASLKPSRIAESSLVPEMEALLFFVFFLFFLDLIFGVIRSLKQYHNKQKQKITSMTSLPYTKL